MNEAEIPELCPAWCQSTHDEVVDGDQRHETLGRIAPVIRRELHGGGAVAEADELHVMAFQFFTDEETWIVVDRLQITPESARRLIRELTKVLNDV